MPCFFINRIETKTGQVCINVTICLRGVKSVQPSVKPVSEAGVDDIAEDRAEGVAEPYRECVFILGGDLFALQKDILFGGAAPCQ